MVLYYPLTSPNLHQQTMGDSGEMEAVFQGTAIALYMYDGKILSLDLQMVTSRSLLFHFLLQQ